VSAAKRYKIERKVREHHRKARKAERDRPRSTSAGEAHGNCAAGR